MKKRNLFLCGLLTMALVVALALPAAASEGPANWTDLVSSGDKTWYTNFTDSTTFEIDSAIKLASVASLVNGGTTDFNDKILVIKADLDLSGNYWVPIGTAARPFKGTIRSEGTEVSDGAGGKTMVFKKITGLTIDPDRAPNAGYYGLVGYGLGATVTQLTLAGTITSVDANAVLGAAMGYAGRSDTTDSEISKVTSQMAVTVEGGQVVLGSLVGQAGGAKLVGCVNDGTIEVTGTGDAVVGGLVGRVTGNTTIAGNIASGASRNNKPLDVAAHNATVGGIVGDLNAGTLAVTSLASASGDDAATGADEYAKYIWSRGKLTVTTDAEGSANVGGFIGSITGSGKTDLRGAFFVREILVTDGSGFTDNLGSANVGGILGFQSSTEKSTLKDCKFTTGFTVTDTNNKVLLDEHSRSGDNYSSLIQVASTGEVYAGGIYGKACDLEVITPTVGDETTKTNPAINLWSTGRVGGIGGAGKAGEVYTSGLVKVTSLRIRGVGIGGAVGGVYGQAEDLRDLQLDSDRLVVEIADAGCGEKSLGGVTGTFTGTADGLSIFLTGKAEVSCMGYECDVGGFAGRNAGTLRNLSLPDRVTVKTSNQEFGIECTQGGLVGRNEETGVLDFCYTAATLVAERVNDLRLGGLAGVNEGEIIHCYRDEEVSVTSSYSSALQSTYLGGLVGENSGTIQKCYMDADVTTADSHTVVGGLVGANTLGGTITDCYVAAGTVRGGAEDSVVGGFIGQYASDSTYPSPVTHCYSAMTVSGGSARGGFFGSYACAGDTVVSRCFYLLDNASQVNANLSSVGSGDATGLASTAVMDSASKAELSTKATFVDWDFDQTWQISSADGRASTYPELIRVAADDAMAMNYDLRWYLSSPTAASFTLSDEGDLVGFAMLVNGDIPQLGAVSFANKTVAVAAPFDLQTGYWIPIGAGFLGTFDGQDHRIGGLRVGPVGTASFDLAGLFRSISPAATVKDLSLEALDITGNAQAGALTADNNGTVTGLDLILNGTVSAAGNACFVGGAVGWNAGSLSDLTVTLNGTVSAAGEDGYVGGVVGCNLTTIDGLTMALKGTVAYTEGSGMAGGVVGWNKSEGSAQGVTVTLDGTVSTASADRHVGGVAGWNMGDLSQVDITVNGTVSAPAAGTAVGGVTGENDGIIEDVTVTLNGTLTGTATVGGVTGRNYVGGADCAITGLTLTASENSLMETTAVGGCVGGAVGDNGISCLFSDGTLTLEGRIVAEENGCVTAGAVARNQGIVSDLEVITGENAVITSGGEDGSGCAAGLVGVNGNTVGGGAAAGGRITDCSVRGGATITGKEYAGGLVGTNPENGVLISSSVEGVTVRGENCVGGAVGETSAPELVSLRIDLQELAVKDVTVTGEGGTCFVGGAIGRAVNAMMADLTLSGDQVTGVQFVGGVIGLAENSILRDLTGSDLTVASLDAPDTAFVGGVAGQILVTENKDNTFALTEDEKLGAFQGVFNAQLTGLTLTATGDDELDVPVDAFVGGLVGRITGGSVYDSSVTGAVSASGYRELLVGGAVGQADGEAYLVNDTVGCTLTLGDGRIYTVGGFAARLENSTARFDRVSSTQEIQVEHPAETGATAVYAGGFLGRLDNETGGTVGNNGASQSVSVNCLSGDANVYAGGFAGLMEKGDLSACYATGNVTVVGKAYSYAGGFVGAVGELAEEALDSCYTARSEVRVDSRYALSGGFAGSIGAGGTVTNCYAVDGDVSAFGTQTAGVGAFAPAMDAGAITSVYAAANQVAYQIETEEVLPGNPTVVVPETTAALNNGVHLEGFDFDSDTPKWCYLSGKNSRRPVLTALEGWDTWPDFALLRSSGLEEIPVADAAQFGTAARVLNDPTFACLLTDGRVARGDVTMDLTGDVALSGSYWAPIRVLEADDVLDGHGHTVSGLTCDAAQYANFGLVMVNNGTIRDLTLSDASVAVVGSPAGLVVGANGETGLVENVTVTKSSLTGPDVAGAVAGTNSGTITGATVTATTTVKGLNAGGIVGTNSGTVQDSATSADVSCQTAGDGTVAGGAVGTNSGAVTGVTSNATVKGTTAGGLVGENASGGTIENSRSEANVTASLRAGGVVGENALGATVGGDGDRGDVISNATVEAPTVGGIAGTNLGTVQNCDTVSAESQLKGGTTAKGRIVGSGTAGEENCRAEQCAKPTFTPTARSFTDSITVTLTSATEGADIYYTLDGSTPTVLSTKYTEPIYLTATTTVRAFAVKIDYADSFIAAATYTEGAAMGGGGGGGGGSLSSKETVEIPLAGSGTSLEVAGTVSGTDVALEEITREELKDVAAGAELVLDLSGLEHTVESVTIPGETWANLAAATPAELTIRLSTGTVAFDLAALTAVAKQAGEDAVQLVFRTGEEAEKTMTEAQKTAVAQLTDPLLLEVYLTNGTERISDLKGGKATLSVKYALKEGQEARGVMAQYLAEDGTATEEPLTYREETADVTVEHFSLYAISYSAEKAALCLRDETCPIAAFEDAEAEAWYHDGVHFVLEQGLMSGYGNGKFGPADTTSRAMVAQILWNLEGKPQADLTLDFSDLEEGKWYLGAIRWAVSEKLMDGYGGAEAGRFGPDDPVTREQLVAILFRYAKYKDYDVSVGEDTNILSYDDAFDIGSWAMPAMQWAVGAGLIEGKGSVSTLAPKAEASRAEIATILLRFCEKVAK